jgi:hypothetical protein
LCMLSNIDLVREKRPYLLIWTADESKRGGVGKLTQRATALYFMKICYSNVYWIKIGSQ